jgi:hypothetical protein
MKENLKNKEEYLQRNCKFQIGDFARLRGQKDSPNVVVSKIFENPYSQYKDNMVGKFLIQCRYWDNRKRIFVVENFEEITLEKVEENAKN